MKVIETLMSLGYDPILEGDNIRMSYKGVGEPSKDKVIPLLQEIKNHKPEVIVYLQREEVKAENNAAREKIDRYFSDVILPKLSNLHQAGKLPRLGEDTLWRKVEKEWNKASIDSTVAYKI